MTNSSLRVLVTSSRTWDDAEYVWRVLDAVFAPLDSMVLAHGACPEGGDHYADQWAKDRIARQAAAILIRRRPAKWSLYGRRAGFVRNEQMVNEGVDLCLAFARLCERPECLKPEPHITHGTDHCMRYAESVEVETRVFRWENR